MGRAAFLLAFFHISLQLDQFKTKHHPEVPCAPNVHQLQNFMGLFSFFHVVKAATNKDSLFYRLLQNSSKMRRVGIEPTTFGLEDQCSIRLSYRPGPS